MHSNSKSATTHAFETIAIREHATRNAHPVSTNKQKQNKYETRQKTHPLLRMHVHRALLRQAVRVVRALVLLLLAERQAMPVHDRGQAFADVKLQVRWQVIHHTAAAGVGVPGRGVA
jgi:hypothetical protein